MARAGCDFMLASVFLAAKNSHFPKLCRAPHGAATGPLASAQPALLREACWTASDLKVPTPRRQPGAPRMSDPSSGAFQPVGLLHGSGEPSDFPQGFVRKGC